MKNLVVGMLVMGALSCTKEKVEQGIQPVLPEAALSGTRTFFDNGGPVEGLDYGCHPPAGNCLDDIIVLGSTYSQIETGVGAVNSGTFDDLLDEEYAFWCDILTQDNVDKILDEILTVSVLGIPSEGIIYFILRDSGNDIYGVYPVREG
ncbi:hypothetical protein GC167_10250 [bacterium]|nr:hypothetical protein [bacterium]